MLHLQQLLPANGRVGVPSTASASSAAFRTVFSLTPCNDATYCAVALRPENADNLSAFFGRRPMRGEWWWNRWNRWNGNFGKSLKARVLGNFRNICSICSICSMRCAAPRKKPPQAKKNSRGGVWSAVRRGLTQTGLPVQRACAGVSRASSATACPHAACWWGGSPSPPAAARRWVRRWA